MYTFATRKLQPMITSETGKALIQTCLNSPDSPPRSDPTTDQRMSATGFEETDLTYQVSESDSSGETKVTALRLPGNTSPLAAPPAALGAASSSGPAEAGRLAAGVLAPATRLPTGPARPPGSSRRCYLSPGVSMRLHSLIKI